MMEIKIEIDETCEGTIVIIKTNKMTDDIDELVHKIAAREQNMIAGFHDETVTLLEQNNILRFFSANQKVYAQTNTAEYMVRLRLYELEERLNKRLFVRISNTEIVNLKAIQNLDLSFTGTIAVVLSNGIVTYVSRRYVAKIKNILGI